MPKPATVKFTWEVTFEDTRERTIVEHADEREFNRLILELANSFGQGRGLVPAKGRLTTRFTARKP